MSTDRRMAWLDGRLVDWADARIHVDTLAVQGGLNAYEVIGAFWSEVEHQLFLFRTDAHLERLAYSTRVMRLIVPYSPDEIVEAAAGLLRANALREDAGVRIVVYLGSGPLSVGGARGAEAGLFMIARPASPELRRPRLHVGTSKWSRLSDTAAPPRVKAGANYHNARLAQLQARIDGYDDAVLLNSAGKVCELPLANLFLVRNGVLHTPSATSGILEGITRRTVIESAPGIGLKVVEREVDRSELYAAEEVFATGTMSGITPVLSVDRYPVGTGNPGKITSRLAALLDGLKRHLEPSPPAWCVPVYVE